MIIEKQKKRQGEDSCNWITDTVNRKAGWRFLLSRL